MLLKSTLSVFTAMVAIAQADSAGYVLPSSGSASTTQFYLGPELSSGTACGVSALPNGESTSGKQGGGPGYLYVGSTSARLLYDDCLSMHADRLYRQPLINLPLEPTLRCREQVGQAVLAECATG